MHQDRRDSTSTDSLSSLAVTDARSFDLVGRRTKVSFRLVSTSE